MSFASYNMPVSADGTLPVKLFGRTLKLKRIKEMGIPCLICYGEHDDLVEKDTAQAPTDFVPAEVTPFPKGHVAMGNIEPLINLPHVRLLVEDEKFWQAYKITAGEVPYRGNLVPDAHLAALLKHHGVRTLFTHDRDLLKFGFLDA